MHDFNAKLLQLMSGLQDLIQLVDQKFEAKKVDNTCLVLRASQDSQHLIPFCPIFYVNLFEKKSGLN